MNRSLNPVSKKRAGFCVLNCFLPELLFLASTSRMQYFKGKSVKWTVVNLISPWKGYFMQKDILYLTKEAFFDKELAN